MRHISRLGDLESDARHAHALVQHADEHVANRLASARRAEWGGRHIGVERGAVTRRLGPSRREAAVAGAAHTLALALLLSDHHAISRRSALDARRLVA